MLKRSQEQVLVLTLAAALTVLVPALVYGQLGARTENTGVFINHVELDSEVVAALARGAEIEDQLVYDEPPGWMQPVRHAWGALLMSAERYEEAERVYRADLDRNLSNGWSLLGLRQAQEAQGEDSTEAAAALEAAWARADVTPTSSCYCEPGA